MSPYDVVAGPLAIIGAVFVLVSAVGMLRMRDALSRVNVLSAATGVGLPAVFVSAWLHRVGVDGWSWAPALKTLVAVLALVVISSVASNALCRATYRSGAPIDPATAPNELAEEPPPTRLRPDRPDADTPPVL